MLCPEYIRLRQDYEAAIRHWGHVILSADAQPVGAHSRQAARIKENAFLKRNAAMERVNAHKRACPTCNPKLRVVRTRVD
jgi:hypothetical protein